MRADKSYLVVSAALFAFIGVVQLLRAVSAWPVEIDGFAVPVAFSFVAGPVFLLLSGWAIAQLRRR